MSENILPATFANVYFLFCKVLLSHSMLSSRPSPFVALAWKKSYIANSCTDQFLILSTIFYSVSP